MKPGYELDTQVPLFQNVTCPSCKGKTMGLKSQLLIHDSMDEDKAIARVVASCPCGFTRQKDFGLTEEVRKIFTAGVSKEMDDFMLGLGFRHREVGSANDFGWSVN